MSAVPKRLHGPLRVWLESPARPRRDPPRVVRKCPEWETWLIGAGKIEAADRLAEHHERCHQ